MRALRDYTSTDPDLEAPIDYTEVLYANGFPDWFVTHGKSCYHWNWQEILITLRNGQFFFSPYSLTSDSIVGEYLPPDRARLLGEILIQKLAALVTTLPTGDSVLRSLELDGFSVNRDKLKLVPLEGPVSAQQEEDALTALVRRSGILDGQMVLRHVADAHSLYADGKDHSSLNESRSLVQALIDGISTETQKNGRHSIDLPSGTANRIDYLQRVGFFTEDEQAAYRSAWGSLSAGSHPGVPEREQARIGLILALEFGQLLLLKFANWRANGYRSFS
jgi:hypothetical protein